MTADSEMPEREVSRRKQQILDSVALRKALGEQWEPFDWLIGYIDGWWEIACKHGVPRETSAVQCQHMHSVALLIATRLASTEAALKVAKEALQATQFGFNHRRCPVCAGWNMGPAGETDKVHTASCPVAKALAQIAALEGKP